MNEGINHELLNATREYNDKRISNIINQSHNYPIEKVEAAKLIAQERYLKSTQTGLRISNNTDLIDNTDLIMSAKRMLENKVSIDEIMSRFEAKGVSVEDATAAVHSASKVADLNKKTVAEEESEEGRSYWWYFFFAFIIIRWIVRANNN